MVPNVVLHLLHEQPLLADLYEPPQAGDVVVVCTNLRTPAGARPIFIDRSESDFVFPYHQIRFLEVPPASGPAGTVAALPERAGGGGPGSDSGLDEDFLRRVRDV